MKAFTPSSSVHPRAAFGEFRIVSLFAFLAALAGAPFASTAEPVRALLITGGGYHDYEAQKGILTEGIGERANVTWVIDHEAGDQSDARVPRLERDNWAKDFDVVVYNACFGLVTDVDYINRIARVHEDGLPAVVLHCSIHSFRRGETDEWRKLLGVSSFSHEGHRSFEVKNLQPDHPIMKPFPATWTTPKGELYKIDKVWPNATVLAEAYGRDTDKNHPTVWINTHGKARVFGTTIGHHNETMAHPTYLDLVSRGLLWTVDKLAADGSPKPGAGPDATEEGFVSLFNGRNLDGWKAGENADSFQVMNGELVVDGPRGHLFYDGPVADANFKDFEFKAEVMTHPKANSGLYFHTRYQESGWPSVGYEAQVNATHSDPRKTGSLYAVKDVMNDAPNKDGEWFDYHITVRGKRIVIKINGETVVDYTEPNNADRLGRGTFAIQAHDPESRIHYRNIRVRPL